MASVRDLYYSPICDKDPRAYLAYVFACSRYGAGNGKLATINGDSGQSRRDSSGFDIDDGASGTVVDVRQVQAADVMANMVACGDIGGVSDIIDNSSKVELGGWFTAAGFSTGDFDRGVSSFDGSGGFVARWRRRNVNDADISNESMAISTGVACGLDVHGGSSSRCVESEREDKSAVGSENAGLKTLANRKKREKKKQRKVRRQLNSLGDVPEWRRKSADGKSFDLKSSSNAYRGAFGSCSEEIRKRLAETRAERLIAENEACVKRTQSELANWDTVQKTRRKQGALKLIKTEQEYELVRTRDIDQLKRRQETRILRDTESNKVAVERAHSTLARTGNVEGGFAATVLTSSISPSSSASVAEVRKLHKENLDYQKKDADQKKQISVLVDKLKQYNINLDDRDALSVGITVDENGDPIGDFGSGYGGYIGEDGRLHQGENYDFW